MTSRKNYSRLAKTERKSAVKSTLLYVVLTVGLIGVLVVFGIPAVSRLSGVIGSFAGIEQTFTGTSGPPPAPPRLNSLPEFTKERKLKISGSSQPGSSIIVHINNTQKEILSDSSGRFTTTHNLKDGETTIFVLARDDAGQESNESRKYSVTFDEEPPELNIITPEEGQSFNGSHEKQQKIEGETEKGASVKINDHIVVVRSDGKFDFPVSLQEGDNEYTIKAFDKAGNETELVYTLKFSS